MGHSQAVGKQRIARATAFREQLSAFAHYGHMVSALNGMAALSGKEDIDGVDKDRFSMLSVIADKHWRVVEKYLPPTPAQAPGSSTPAQSQLSTIVAALLAPKHSDTQPIVDSDTSTGRTVVIVDTNQGAVDSDHVDSGQIDVPQIVSK
jgi:hypothetical protein